MKPIVLLTLVFFSLSLKAQLESPFQYGAQFLRLGNAGVGMTGHSSILFNPAGITDAEELSFSVDGAQLYNNSGLLHFHAAAVIPSKKLGTFGVRVQRYGLEGFNYQNYSLTYARALFINLKMAVTFNFYQFQIDGFGNTFEPNLELGFLSDLNDNLSLGVHIANPLPIAISENTSFPTVFTAGASYKISEVVRLNADIEKNILKRENIKFGFTYQIHSSFAISAGFNTYPATFYFGFELIFNNLELNLGNGYDQVLGNSTGLGLIYRISK